MKIDPLHPSFAACVLDIDLSMVTKSSGSQEIIQAFEQYGLLVFPNQSLTSEGQLRFAKLFGELESFPEATMQKDSEKVYNVSNIDASGNIPTVDDIQILNLKGTQLWHTDSSYRHIPALASFLMALELPDSPESGDTEFADMFAAYDSLPDELRTRLKGRHMVHNYEYERIYVEPRLPPIPAAEKALVPPVTHPVLRYHPDRDRHSVYITTNVGGEIGGLNQEEGKKLHKETINFVTQPRFVYRHQWSLGDLLMWDNRRLLHRVLPYPIDTQRRKMRRTSVSDVAPPQIKL
jgi:taurine dioxygenase/alpha-ketoglutarate-dependent 2,4-dichlorophenoxyacetate dioxygenase